MADLYGVDVRGLTDLDDPEVLVAEDILMAYALGRRLLEAEDAHDETGDTEPYECMDVRDWLGRRFDSDAISDLETHAKAVLLSDTRVASVQVSATYTAGGLSVAVSGIGTNGPFAPFVVSVDQITAQILLGG